jgi:hypothetical protein
MPGIKISQLPNPSTVNTSQIATTDIVPAAREGTTQGLLGAAFINTLSAIGNGTSLVGTKSFDINNGIRLNVKSVSATSPIVLTEYNNVLTHSLSYDNSLTVTNNLLGVKIAAGGGLIADSSGIKLAPASAPATNIAVRQNDTSSPLGAATDNPAVKRSYPTTGNDTGVLQPYFQTFQGACNYANANFSSSYNIYIDTDTIEGTPSPDGYAPVVANDSVKGQFFSDAEIQTAFGGSAAAAAGLKAGNFIFNGYYNVANSVFSGWAFGASLSVPANGNIYSRYYRNSLGYWTTNRKYNEAPRKIIARYYFDTTAALTAPFYNGLAMTGGSLGTVAANWTKWSPNNYPTVRTGYHGTRLGSWNSKFITNFINICFEYFSNASDNAIQEPSNGNVTYYNCTIACLGPGYYNYSYLYPTQNVSVCSRGIPLQDPGSSDTAPAMSYPGYGLALIGNPSGSQFGPTKVNSIISITDPSNPWVSFWTYDQFVYSTAGGSGATGSTILDGTFNIGNGGGIFAVTNSNTFITNGVVLSGSGFGYQAKGIDASLTTNNGFTTDNYNTCTYVLGKGVTVTIPGLGSFLANWTYHYLLGPTPTQTQSNVFYPVYAWYYLPAGGTTLPGSTVNTTTNIITINSDITTVSNIHFNSYAPQAAKASSGALTGFQYGGVINASTGLLPISVIHSITSPWNSQTYTLNYYQ